MRRIISPFISFISKGAIIVAIEIDVQIKDPGTLLIGGPPWE
jgi:hypothetical protein